LNGRENFNSKFLREFVEHFRVDFILEQNRVGEAEGQGFVISHILIRLFGLLRLVGLIELLRDLVGLFRLIWLDLARYPDSIE
jgi:hypothetical protein